MRQTHPSVTKRKQQHTFERCVPRGGECTLIHPREDGQEADGIVVGIQVKSVPQGRKGRLSREGCVCVSVCVCVKCSRQLRGSPSLKKENKRGGVRLRTTVILLSPFTFPITSTNLVGGTLPSLNTTVTSFLSYSTHAQQSSIKET